MIRPISGHSLARYAISGKEFRRIMGYPIIRPLGNRLLIRRLSLPEESKGGLFILGREYPTIGVVLAVGNGPRQGRFGLGERMPIDDIEVGDEVTFDKWASEAKQFGPENDLIILDYDSCFLRIRKNEG